MKVRRFYTSRMGEVVGLGMHETVVMVGCGKALVSTG